MGVLPLKPCYDIKRENTHKFCAIYERIITINKDIIFRE